MAHFAVDWREIGQVGVYGVTLRGGVGCCLLVRTARAASLPPAGVAVAVEAEPAVRDLAGQAAESGRPTLMLQAKEAVRLALDGVAPGAIPSADLRGLHAGG